MLVVALQEGDLACVEVVPKPWGGQLGLGGEVERVLVVGGLVGVVGDQEEGRNLEVGGLGAWDPKGAGRIDPEREQEEAVCRHDLGDQVREGEGLGQEVEVLEGLGDLVDQEGDVGGPASHQGNVVVVPQDQQVQESGLPQDQVVRGTGLFLDP